MRWRDNRQKIIENLLLKYSREKRSQDATRRWADRENRQKASLIMRQFWTSEKGLLVRAWLSDLVKEQRGLERLSLEEIKSGGKLTVLDRSREKALAYLAKKGNEKALYVFWRANMGLVAKAANDLWQEIPFLFPEWEGMDVDKEVLIQEGHTRFQYILNRFDPKQGTKFSTLAYMSLKRWMLYYVESKSQLIKLPRFYQENKEYRKDRERIVGNFSYFDSLNFSEYNEDFMDGYVLFDPSKIEPAAQNRQSDLIFFDEIIEKILNGISLENREQDIIRLRLQGYTLDEIGQKYLVTRERIRQILEDEIAPKIRMVFSLGSFEKIFNPS